MTGHDQDRSGSGEHFDEMDAVRRFPSEDAWLDQPMPEELVEPAAAQTDAASAAFADRIMQARNEELTLDRQLEELDRELPGTLLEQMTAPESSDAFVENTVARLQQDRRHRWQTLLARYVAPEPSPAFVSRTLAALTPEDETTRAAANDTASQPRPGVRRPWLPATLTALAAAALLWLMLNPTDVPPLELRLAQQASPAVAYADSSTPLAAVLAQVAADDEPFAVFDAPADGLWLATASGVVR